MNETNAGHATGAVILCGGLARRMGGQDKGLVLLAGKPMASYAVATVKPMVDRCVINANRNQLLYEKLGVPVVADVHEGHLGPLAGLSAAIEFLNCEHVCMCPCDSPFLQAGLIETLLSGCIEADADIAVAHDGERLQPVFIAVHRRVKPSLDRFLHAGERKIDRWFTQHSTLEVSAREFTESFRNINTKDELKDAEQVMKG